MSFNWLFCLIFLGISSCSNLSKNNIAQGEFPLQNGVHQEQSWHTSLNFKRTSWYRELSLIYDLYLVKIDKEDKTSFYHWFSPSGKELVANCKHFYVALKYSLDEKKISHSLFKERMKKVGFEQVVIAGFKKNLQLHPDFEKNNFSLYKIVGFCGQQNDDDDIEIDLPGMKKIKIN